MKNCKVKVTRYFKDKVEQVERNVNDEFLCDKERYEFLKANNAVELIGIVVEDADTIEVEKEAIIDENELTEEEKNETAEVVSVDGEEIVVEDEKTETDEGQVTIDEAINDAVEEAEEKKSSKKNK